MSTKSVSYSEIGSSCPSQNIQPAGAKLPANILISPTYGCAISDLLLGLRRENALKRNAEVEHPKRLHVQMRLTAAHVSHAGGIHSSQVLIGRLIQLCRTAGELIADRNNDIAIDRGGIQRVRMGGNLTNRKRVRLFPTLFT